MGTLLALDPGGTTGIAVFNELELVHCAEIPSSEISHAAQEIAVLIQVHKPKLIVYEGYRVYKWKRDQHIGNELPTVQLIGAIKVVASMFGLPMIEQTAQQAKGFCTDDKLKAWGMWQKGMRHARDAIRHGCWWLMFHKSVPEGYEYGTNKEGIRPKDLLRHG